MKLQILLMLLCLCATATACVAGASEITNQTDDNLAGWTNRQSSAFIFYEKQMLSHQSNFNEAYRVDE